MRIFSLLFAMALVISTPIEARVGIQKNIGAWHTATYVLDNGGQSCQAIQCASGDCQTNRYFLLVTAPGQSQIVPQFNNGWELPKSAMVTIKANGKNFSLINRSGGPSKFLEPRDNRDLRGILKALEAVDGASPSVFWVIDQSGTKSRFHARGASGTIDFLAKKCRVPRP